jgi:hypothetical protein
VKIKQIVVKQTTRLLEAKCQGCGRKLNAASSEEMNLPKPGDVTICLYCGAFLEFDSEMIPRSMLPESLKSWQMDSPDTYRKALEVQRDIRAALFKAYVGPKPDDGPLQ